MGARILSLILCATFVAACGSDAPTANPNPNDLLGQAPGRDAGPDADAAATELEDGAIRDAHAGADASPSFDAGMGDAGAGDAQPMDQGTPDAQSGDATSGDAGFADASPPDAGPPAGNVALRFTGCNVDFSGDIFVSYNGSLGVGSIVNQSQLTGSLQFDLANQRGAIALSSQHRVDTGLVVNLIDGSGTWTNLDMDYHLVVQGQKADYIQGQLQVNSYTPASGVSDIAFQGVVLQHVSHRGLCQIDGQIQTSRLGY